MTKTTAVTSLTSLEKYFYNLLTDEKTLNLNLNEMLERAFEKNREFKRKPQKMLKKSAQNALNLFTIQQRQRQDPLDGYIDEQQDELQDDEDLMDGDGVSNASENGLFESMNTSLLKLYSSSSKQSQNLKESANQSHLPNPDDATADQPSKIVALAINDEPSQNILKRKTKEGQSSTKKQKVSLSDKWPTPTTRLADMGGMDEILQEILQLIGMPLLHPEIFLQLGIDPPRGILLQGAPGCGKTMLAHAIAGEAGVPFISIAAPTIVSGMSGESEKKIREVFEEAKELAPCILFIDEIDAITPKRETAQREMERRIVAQLLTCMDTLSLAHTNGKAVLVIGATNRPDSLDAALRRAGRFDREICVPVPDMLGREKILRKLAGRMVVDGHVSFLELAKLTPGFVGADLKGLMGEAGMIAVKRIFSGFDNTSAKAVAEASCCEEEAGTMMVVDNVEGEATATSASSSIAKTEHTESIAKSEHPESIAKSEHTLTFSSILKDMPTLLPPHILSTLSLSPSDFFAALPKVQPSSKREGFASIPGVSWSDIGALEGVRDELRMAVVEPIRHPEFFESVGVTCSMGVLLFGPPGCGKTLLAKAVANESHCNFLSVKGPELINKYVGESERAIRMVFSRAQASSPCVIFFDEIDAICPSRSSDTDSQSTSRLVNTLLTEMDGMQGRKLVFVIAATNRPDMIDPAMLRPGRLDKSLYVDLPNEQERHSILKALTQKTPLCPEVDLASVASDHRTDGMSGADLASLVREASVNRVRQEFYSPKAKVEVDVDGPGSGVESRRISQVFVTSQDFEVALGRIRASVGDRDRIRYEEQRIKFCGRH